MIVKLYFTVAMVIIIYISVNSVKNFNVNFEYLEESIDEFKQGFIDDIVIGVNTTCPGEYKTLIKKMNWPGSSKGCRCTDKVTGIFKYYQEKCPNSDECVIFPETQPFTFSKWRSSTICYRRSNMTYSDLNLIEEENKSKCMNSTHKVCGIVDNLNNLLCTEKNNDCPVTTIKLTSNDELDKMERKNSKILKINEKMNLYFSKNENELEKIKIFFRTDLSQPCLNPKKCTSNQLFFPFMKNRFVLSCDKFENGTEIKDKSYIPLDQYNLNFFYKENNFSWMELIEKEYLDKNLTIYTRGYQGWSRKCIKGAPESFNSFLKLSSELNELLITLIAHSFGSLSILIAIGTFACYLSRYSELFFKSMNIGIIIFNLVCSIQIISNSNWVVNILTDEDGILCGDDSFNIFLQSVSTSCLNLQYSFIIILLLAILSCVVFIYSVYTSIRPTTREIQEKFIELKY